MAGAWAILYGGLGMLVSLAAAAVVDVFRQDRKVQRRGGRLYRGRHQARHGRHAIRR